MSKNGCRRLPPDIPSQKMSKNGYSNGSSCLIYNLEVKRQQTKAQDAVQVAVFRSYFSEDDKRIKQNRTYQTPSTPSDKHSINFLFV
jgi:hypothetical protein